MKQLQIDFNSPTTACAIPCVSVSYLGEGKTCKTCAWWTKVVKKVHPNVTIIADVFPCYHPYSVQNLTFGEQERKATDSCERWQYER